MPEMKSLVKSLSVFVFGILVFCIYGCIEEFPSNKEAARKTFVPPLYQQGTVAQYARLIGGRHLPVRGYGLVIGLGKDGTTQVPPRLEQYMVKQLRIHGVGSARHGINHVSPSRMLRDLDTAVVEITGFIQPAAPKDKMFDIQIRAVGGDVRSLDGGYLMPSDMRFAVTSSNEDPERGTRIYAKARGHIFVNPFIDEDNPADRVKLRRGKIIEGGSVVKDRTVRLQLYTADYAKARLLQKAINARFQRAGSVKVAKALNSSTVDLRIPDRWRSNYEHFLDLVMHLPLRVRGGGWEAQARAIGKEMELPTADHNQLALVWEAMDKKVLPLVGTYYSHKNPYVSYYAARTGMRLRDLQTAPEVVLRIAQSSKHPLQLTAIEELGKTPTLLRSVNVLQKLLDNDNEFVRVAAYEALRQRGFTSMVESVDLGDGAFTLDIVQTAGKNAIYATQSDYSRIVIFGRDMQVSRPVFFSLPDSLLTINAVNPGDKLTVYRKVEYSGRKSPPTKIDPYVRTLIEFLGNNASADRDGKISGLGLTYSQVVSTLYRMCKSNFIPAKFVLQKSTRLQDFLKDAGETGRPN